MLTTVAILANWLVTTFTAIVANLIVSIAAISSTTVVPIITFFGKISFTAPWSHFLDPGNYYFLDCCLSSAVSSNLRRMDSENTLSIFVHNVLTGQVLSRSPFRCHLLRPPQPRPFPLPLQPDRPLCRLPFPLWFPQLRPSCWLVRCLLFLKWWFGEWLLFESCLSHLTGDTLWSFKRA